MIEFMVSGKPIPQGSMRSFHPRKAGKLMMRGTQPVCNLTSDNPDLKAWRKAIAAAAKEVWPAEPLDEPLHVDVLFYRSRPKSRTDEWDDTGPDVDKLLRAIFDGITGVIVRDDKRIVSGSHGKRFTDDEGYALVRVESHNRKIGTG